MKIKIILSIVIMMMISFSGFSLSHKKAPSKAREYIQENYAQAGKIHWGKSHDLVTAYFEENGRDVILFFNKEGALKQSEEDITPDQIPSEIKNKIEPVGSQVKYESILKIKNQEEEGYYYLITTKDKNERKYITETYATEDGTKFEAYKYKDKKNRAVLVGILALFPLLLL